MGREEHRRHELAEGATLGEVAAYLGVTTQAVANVERRAIRRLWRMQCAAQNARQVK